MDVLVKNAKEQHGDIDPLPEVVRVVALVGEFFEFYVLATTLGSTGCFIK